MTRDFPIDDAGALRCDLDVLVDTRLLIQANSGGGKSFVVRRVLEQTHGRVQQLVIDPEGEFASLRERFDYVHAAAAGGDTAAHPRSAGLLAERLLELGVSAILDLYELSRPDRVRFVRLFLEALIEAPKRLWHPVLVVVDEAHTFCPESDKAESSNAVIELASRGRKRGYSAILATQRIQKLNKDAAADLNNKLIGRTSLDVDLARASNELGFPRARWAELRDLEPGQFFATGPAFSSRGVTSVRIGKVKTTHPKAGARIAFKVAPPTSAIKALLPKLSDLPAEAEERARTVEDLTREVQRLEREAKARTRPSAIDEGALRDAFAREANAIEARHLAQIQKVRAEISDLRPLLTTLLASSEKAAGVVTRIDDAIASIPAKRPKFGPMVIGTLPPAPVEVRPLHPKDRPVGMSVAIVPPAATTSDGRGPELSRGERKTLTAIAQSGEAVGRDQLSVLVGYKKSSRDLYVQKLVRAGLVCIVSGEMLATDAGLAVLGPDFERLPTGDDLRTYWLERLQGGERAIFAEVLNAYPHPIDRAQLGESAGYKKSSRDVYVQRLARTKLVTLERGAVRASDQLFDVPRGNTGERRRAS